MCYYCRDRLTEKIQKQGFKQITGYMIEDRLHNLEEMMDIFVNETINLICNLETNKSGPLNIPLQKQINT